MHSKIRIITTWLCFAIIGTFVGCVEETTKMLPGSTGKAGEVVVVMDPVYWTGDLGQHVKDNLAREHTGLPQPEPIFNIVPLPTASFKGLFITHRNIILFSIGKDNPAKIIKTKNKWATSQVVITVSAPSAGKCLDLLQQDSQELERILTVTERFRLRQKFQSISNKELASKLTKKFGLSLAIPPDYLVASDKDDFIWFKKETPQISQGIFIYTYEKGDQGLDNVSWIVAMRDSIAKAHVPGPADGSYMGTMADFTPITQPLDFNGTLATETRGLWNVVGDFMGGPFISLTLMNDDQDKVICIDGYVYAPKYDKRNYLRQVEAILYSLQVI